MHAPDTPGSDDRARRRPALRGLLAALLLAAGAGAQALGSDYGYDSFKTPDAVTLVQLCGTWGKDRQGTYRIVQAEQYAQSFLYVQWMTRDTNGSLHAEHTVSIAELNNDHAEISLSALTCHATPRGITLSAQASSGHDDRLRSITIDLGAPQGPYRYRQRRAPGPVTRP